MIRKAIVFLTSKKVFNYRRMNLEGIEKIPQKSVKSHDLKDPYARTVYNMIYNSIDVFKNVLLKGEFQLQTP